LAPDRDRPHDVPAAFQSVRPVKKTGVRVKLEPVGQGDEYALMSWYEVVRS